MLVDEEDVVFEARVQVWFETQMHNHRVVVAVYVGVDTVEALEELAKKAWEGFREWYTLREGTLANYFRDKWDSCGWWATHQCDWGTSVHCRYCSEPTPSGARYTPEPASSLVV